jgi:non-specific serine/threonine protein kinase
LERLVDKSFLSMEEGKDGSARHRLLRLLRQYGEERLSESGETGIRHLHARHFLTVAEDANKVLLEGGDQAGALSELEQDHDDVTAALRWALEADPGLAIRLATAMGYYWRWQGYFRSEGRRFLEQAISHAEEGTVAKALALLPLSGIAVRQGDFAAAREHAEQAAQVARDLGDVKIQARANLALGMAAHGTGDLAAARAAYRRVLSLTGERGREMAGALNNLAVIEYDEGHYQEARTLIKQALKTLAGRRDQLALSQVLDTALRIDLALLDLLEARQRAAELVKLSWERQLSPVSSLLDSIAILLVNESRPRKALQVAGAAAAFHERIGSDSPPPWLRERDHALSRARKTVGEGSSQRLFALGREMSVESALQLAGLREPTSDPLADALADLTDRQRQIATFVAQGLTNQEIGRRLGISARTVDAHLEHVRNRLEVRSRAEIAAWLSTRTTASATGVGSEPPSVTPRRVAGGSGC